MKKIRENSNMTVMNVDLVEKRKNEIIQIESAETHEGCKPLFLVEYGGNTEAELRSQFYEEFQEGFQKDEIELMGRKCSEWNSIFHEWAQIELYQKEQAELSNSVNELTNTKTELENKVAELEKENKEILEDNDILNKWIDKLKEQNEKMKCCGNCNYFKKDLGLCFYSGGDEDYFCRLRRWELAE